MLADIYEFKVAEINEILNMSMGVVKHLLFEGRKNGNEFQINQG